MDKYIKGLNQLTEILTTAWLNFQPDSIEDEVFRIQLSDFISAIGVVAGKPAIENRYTNIAQMLGNQGQQTDKGVQRVLDASADPNVTSGYAYYEKLPASSASLSDYLIASKEEDRIGVPEALEDTFSYLRQDAGWRKLHNDVAFSVNIPFDYILTTMATQTVAAQYNFSAFVPNAKNGFVCKCVLIANGNASHIPTFSTMTKWPSSGDWKNEDGTKNIILFTHLNGIYYYKIENIVAGSGISEVSEVIRADGTFTGSTNVVDMGDKADSVVVVSLDGRVQRTSRYTVNNSGATTIITMEDTAAYLTDVNYNIVGLKNVALGGVTPPTLISVQIPIGEWNMESDLSKTVFHGISEAIIRGISAVIFSDGFGAVTSLNEYFNYVDGLPNGSIDPSSGGSVTLVRRPGGQYDDPLYNDAAQNRGYILITYDAS